MTDEAQDRACAELVEQSAAEADGLVQVEVDPTSGRLTLTYDRARLSPADAERLARRLAAAFEERPARCTLHVQGQGGRSCETCALALERRLQALPGVRQARVSFRGGVLHVIYDAAQTTPEELARVVERFGVRTLPPKPAVSWRIWLEGTRREALFVALTLAGLVTGWLAGRLGAPLVAAVAYGVAYVFGGWDGLRNGIGALRHRTVDVDLLMVLAALGALVIGAPAEGATLLFLFSLSNLLQHYAIGRSRRAIQALMELRPDRARVLREGQEVEVPVEEVRVGEVFVLRPGDRVPLDGVIVRGESALDESSITGESMPVDKGPGQEVFAGTINTTGSLEVRVTRPASASTLARMIELVEQAQSEKAVTQRLIDRLEQPYALGVLAMTALAIVIPVAFLNEPFARAFYRAMTLMVAASPCAVVISTPAAVLSAIAAGARRGVLFKGGVYVEALARVRAIAFDKTGTLTEGRTRLVQVGARPSAGLSEDELLRLAAAVQQRSEHHLARATVAAARERGLTISEAEGFQAVVGKGVRAVVEGATLHVGNLRYFEAAWQAADGFDEGRAAVEALARQGRTAVLVARERDGQREVLGWLAFADRLRPGAAETIRRLRELGVAHVALLTGDNRHVAEAIGREAGVDAVHAELLPAQKVAHVKALVDRYGAAAMVGDGVNDAPALAAATVGIAMGGAGTDVALETADVVLMRDDLAELPYVLALSRATRRTLLVNFAIAFGMMGLMIGAILLQGLPLPLAVVGHEGSTVLVSLNGLRLLRFRAS
ncbi:heavy metal translocating P-type ATPase [Rhodothermus marinus SG0.5JP17-172]|uniref:heavy metal translocating P-type ATPase n=1 Tax=Rhodothermus marinus TaxID=29549 RepID=UPI000223D9EB|nr:heavy metal translocating P-type ATPase [Rhodothermus marinus]AEN72464.1 heavy metal translocating P-type ATPase [Rhodothermus marinus SG0.5JP17-172]